MRYRAPTLILIFSFLLFHVGLCPQGNLPLHDAWLHHSRRKGSQHVDRVDLSPCNHQSRHVLKIRSKWGDQRLTWRHVDASRAFDPHRTCNFENAPHLFIESCNLHGTPSDGRHSSCHRFIMDTSSSHLATRGAFRSIKSPSDGRSKRLK